MLASPPNQQPRTENREQHNKMKPQIMLDLETLGTRPGSVITSIGAVKFAAGQRTRHNARRKRPTVPRERVYELMQELSREWQ